MGSNSFGNIFRITTWGESHGVAVGVVIDGCPSGLLLSEEDIQKELDKRAPGKTFCSPRKEKDQCRILSGIFEGKTTGAPISVLIENQDADSKPYHAQKDLLKPGHAHFTYLEKYKVFDYRGGGRSSARETACRVAAGAVAKKLLQHYQIHFSAYLQQIGKLSVMKKEWEGKMIRQSQIFCPDPSIEEKMKMLLQQLIEEGDSIGGVVAFYVTGLPVGLGDPVYEKLEANLAKAFLSLPATKGFEMGEGFAAAEYKGSQHNDLFTEKSTLRSNHSGGTLGGISTGMPLFGRIVFKPTSSIKKKQTTINYKTKEKATFSIPPTGRHDPCVAIRAVPVVEAMLALVLADALLMNRAIVL